MIPLKLQLKNFLSYGSDIQTIDFSQYHLICLSGKNGHGKSALLDAITWALWGQARKTTGTAKADHGLLRLGQTQMMVCLDFELNGQTYRVRREFAQTYGKPYAALDFGLLDIETDTLIPLSEKTIRATQEKIEHTLNLSYESFTNSAFLRQGQSNEFSKKSPKDRKEILANILGLDQYETLRKLAMEKAKQASNEKNNLCSLQEKIEEELKTSDEVKKGIAEVAQQLKDVATKEKAFEKQKALLEKDIKELTNNQHQHKLLSFKLKQLEEREAKQQTMLRKIVAQWRSVHKQLLQGGDHQRLEKEKEQLIKIIQEHQEKLQLGLKNKEAYLKQKEELQQLEQELQQQHSVAIQKVTIDAERLTLEQKTTQGTIEKLNTQCESTQREYEALKKEIATLEKETTISADTQKMYQEIEKQFERRKEYYQKFIAQGNLAKRDLDALHQKKLLTHDEQDPSCPLCEQNLSASRRRFLQGKFEHQERFLQHRFARMAKVIKNLKTILFEQHEQLTTWKKERETHQRIKAGIDEKKKTEHKLATTIKKQHEAIATHEKQLETIAKNLEDTIKQHAALEKQGAQQLEQNEQYTKLKQSLEALVQKTKKLSYDAKQHENDTKALQEIERALKEHEQLLAERTLQGERKQQVNQLCSELKKVKTEKAELNKDSVVYKDLEGRTKNLEQKTTELTTAVKEMHTHKEQLLQTKGSLETKQETLKKQENEHKEQVKTIKKLNGTIDDYQTIATAMGKNGIQALLIEESIPEIEQEANYLLAKLTNNQAQVFIESLRDLKKGGTKETLDIKISDAAGIRPYELFSGGEAFRIDFALRIAISKLLARRAGTSMQTLIIDEGFGSQDEEGLANIMDAIYKIQDDFSKVIIVSHLSSMKDQFPVHFFIEKGPSGSKVNVIEQG